MSPPTEALTRFGSRFACLPDHTEHPHSCAGSQVPAIIHSEGDCVAIEALTMFGNRYAVRRELHSGVVDCSTLVSQALWVGAGVRAPFKAEAQRADPCARNVPHDELCPGDIAIAYDSLSAAPGGRHNHVALYVGEDDFGENWFVESVEGQGVVFTAQEDIRREGGFRRYCPQPESHFVTEHWQSLARMVPKLGRLGCRLTTGSSTHHRRHLGTDIVIGQEIPIVAPVAGVVTRVIEGAGNDRLIEIESWQPIFSVHVMGPIANLGPAVGDMVGRGETLGLSSREYLHGCNVTSLSRGRQRLHWEAWGSGDSPVLGFKLSFATRATALSSRNPHDLLAQNPIYLVKLGAFSNPLGGVAEDLVLRQDAQCRC